MSRAPIALVAAPGTRALALAALLALVAGAHALAASGPAMPEGIAGDGRLTVAMVDWLAAVPRPVAGAEVVVSAVRDGTVIGSTTTRTGSAGIAELRGLPRAITGSPVELHVAASRSADAVDADGCVMSESWTAGPAVVRSAVAARVELDVARTSSMVCLPTSADAEPGAGTASAAVVTEPGGVPPGVPVLLTAIGAALVGIGRLLRRRV